MSPRDAGGGPKRHGAAAAVGVTWIRDLFRLAEAKAEVKHVDGRGTYGLRRVALDKAKELGISREGLKSHGGWVDTQVPDSIYAERDAEHARREARDARSKIRGEAATPPSEE